MCIRDRTTSDQINEQINNHAYSQWHLSGTAAMGSEINNDAVVDVEGKVFGIANLRVIDASIMPIVTNGNTNCPTIMLAEKLSDTILQKNN